MEQTRILLFVIVALVFIISVAGTAKLVVPNNDGNETVAVAQLCAAYFRYADETHHVIDTLDKKCYR